jgi:hypothetical protein
MLFIFIISDDIHVLWNYLETLMTQLNVQLHDEAIVAIAYDTRFVNFHI